MAGVGLNLWRGDRAGHRTAAHIGWAFRGRKRKKGPSKPGAYLRAAGITPRALARYRSRHPLTKRLIKRRGVGVRRALGVRLNRRPGSYARFVRKFAARSRLRGPALFRAAGRAWGGGAWRNADPFPMLNARRKVRRNQIPGLVYYNAGKKRRKGRGRRGRVGRNAVLPYLAWNAGARKGRRRGRRGRVGRNAVLPYAAFNPAYDDNPMESLGEAVETTFSAEFWTETVIPMGAGYLGGQFAGGLVYGLVSRFGGDAVAGKGVVPTIARVGSRALGAAAVSAAAFFVTKDRDVAGKVLAGGLVAVLASIVQEVIGIEAYKTITGMAEIGDMAQDLTEELKARIAESVRGEIARSEGAAGYQAGVNAFVTAESLQPAPYVGPGPRVGEIGMYPTYGQVYGQPGASGVESFVTTQELSTAPVAPGAGGIEGGMVADLSMFSDTFADASLV